MKFVHRPEREMQIHRAIENDAVVVVQGAPGMGKSSIVNFVARQCVADPSRHGFHHVHWISARRGLTKVWLNEVLSGVAAAAGYLRIAQLRIDDLQRKMEEVNAILADRRVLIILDNFEEVNDESLLSWLLNLPEGSKAILVNRLNPDRQLPALSVVEIEGLTDDEAVDFLKQQAEERKITAYTELQTRRDLLRLIRAVEGNPQALEQVIGLMAAGKRNLPEITHQLEQGRGREIAEILKRLFSWSWNLLSPDAHKILLVTPLFPVTSIRRDALQAAADLCDPLRFNAASAQVMNFKLMECDDVHERFLVHPMIRAFARQQLDLDGALETGARSRIIDYFLGFAQRAILREQPNRRYWNALVTDSMAAIDPEWPSIRQAMAWADDHDSEKYVQFVMTLVHYFDSRFLNAERLACVSRAIEVLQRKPGREQDVALFKIDALGWTYVEEGDLSHAWTEIADGLRLANRHATDEKNDLLALACTWRARVKMEERETIEQAGGDGRREAAQAHAARNDALNLAKTARRWIRARVKMMAGDMAFKEGDYDSALQYYRRAAADEEKYGGEGELYQLAPRLGLTYLAMGRLADAESMFNELATRERIAIAKLYGEYGLALVDFKRNNIQVARERAGRLRCELERKTSSNLLKRMIDKLFADIQSAAES